MNDSVKPGCHKWKQCPFSSSQGDPRGKGQCKEVHFNSNLLWKSMGFCLLLPQSSFYEMQKCLLCNVDGWFECPNEQKLSNGWTARELQLPKIVKRRRSAKQKSLITSLEEHHEKIPQKHVSRWKFYDLFIKILVRQVRTSSNGWNTPLS